MRVAIDAQIIPGGFHGGVEQVAICLIRALGKLNDGPEEYIVVAHRNNPTWLSPYLGSNQRIVTIPSQVGKARAFWKLVQRAVMKSLARARRGAYPSVKNSRSVARSSGFYESLGVDLVHFTFQGYYRSDLLSIYNPHDLQHLHYPQFFTAEEVAYRELLYRTGIFESRAVTVPSRSAKNDIVQQYGVQPEKILVTHWAPPTELDNEEKEEILFDLAAEHQLPNTFAFYPAQTWEHKNHLRLLEALALLRDRDNINLNLVCTGKKSDFWQTIEKRIGELGLEKQTFFLGFVEPMVLRRLYHLAQFVIHPSLFEGGGLPILEAFREGVPVACSNVTSLPEYAGDAAMYFDPTDVGNIAATAKRIMLDSECRESLRARGLARVRLFSWERTARKYRALYRQVAGRVLSDQDRQFLSDD